MFYEGTIYVIDNLFIVFIYHFATECIIKIRDIIGIYGYFLLFCMSLCIYYKEVMRIVQYIGVILFFFLVSCGKDDVEPQKTRTLMVYLAGDNTLSSAMQKNINDMMVA